MIERWRPIVFEVLPFEIVIDNEERWVIEKNNAVITEDGRYVYFIAKNSKGKEYLFKVVLDEPLKENENPFLKEWATYQIIEI